MSKVKALEWRVEEPNWWVATPDVFGGRGYEVRLTNRNSVRVRKFSEDWAYFDGTIDGAKEAAQADFERLVLSALVL